MLAAPAIYGSMAISILKGMLGGHWLWRLLLLPIIIVHYLILAGLPPSVLDMLPYVLGVWLVAICSSMGFDRLYKELAQRTKAKRLLNSLLIALLPAAILPISFAGLAGSRHLLQEIALYCGLLFAVGFWAPLSIRASNQSAALAAQIFASLPVIIFNLINIALVVVCCVVGKATGLNIGWHALASALLIVAATSGATAGGAACGCAISRLHRHRI